MYNNYETTSICEKFSFACEFIPNQCCLYYNTSNPNRCGNNSCLLWSKDYMQWDKPGLLRFYVFMPLQFLIVFSIVLLYEAGLFRKLSYIISNLFQRNKSEINYAQIEEEQMYDDLPKDSDVIEEENRISNLYSYQKEISSSINTDSAENVVQNFKQETFIIDKLTKYYGNFMAVKGISFAISDAECFGLLGI